MVTHDVGLHTGSRGRREQRREGEEGRKRRGGEVKRGEGDEKGIHSHYPFHQYNHNIFPMLCTPTHYTVPKVTHLWFLCVLAHSSGIACLVPCERGGLLPRQGGHPGLHQQLIPPSQPAEGLFRPRHHTAVLALLHGLAAEVDKELEVAGAATELMDWRKWGGGGDGEEKGEVEGSSGDR